MSFRLKTILGLALFQAVLLVVLIVASLDLLRESNEDELIKRARTTAALFAASSQEALLATDIASLESVVDAVYTNPGVIYARVIGETHGVLAQRGDSEVLSRTFKQDRRFSDVDDGIFDTSADIAPIGKVFGRVEIGLSARELETYFVDARNKTASIALLGIALTAIFSYLLGSYLTRELRALAAASRRVADGDLGLEIPVRGRDEVAQTVEAFNRMSKKLLDMYSDLRTALNSAQDEGRKLAQSEAQLRRAQRVAQIGNWDYLPEEGALRWSTNVYQIFGVPHDQSISYEYFISRVHADDRKSLERAVDEALANKTAIEEEFRIVRPGGEVRALRVLAEPSLGEGNAWIGLFGVVQDITKRVQAEEQARQALVEKTKAEGHNKAKSQFLANMSHELRTPLNAIIGYSEMLEEDVIDGGNEELAPDLKKIQSAGKHLLGLINEVLDLSKIEAGKMEIYAEEIDVHGLLSEVVATAEPLAAKCGNRFEAHFAADSGVIYTDITKLRQVLLNLLSNACKFTQNGEITFSCHRQRIVGQEWLCFEVKDTGIGMSKEQLDRVFKPFSQADNSTTRKYGGTGLGLAISKRLCEMLGGDISVISEPQCGSTFTVRLPLRIETESEDANESNARRIVAAH